jgi:hypothetical protein
MNFPPHLNAMKPSRVVITQIRIIADVSLTVSVRDDREEHRLREVGCLCHTGKTGRSRRLQLITEFEIYSHECVFVFAGIPQPSTQYRTTSTTEPSILPEKGE